MNKIKKMALLPVLALLSIGAQAELISTDWKANNDKLVTLDSETGIEWLKLSETRNKSIAEIQGLLTTTYNGWRLPTETEVENYMIHFIALEGVFDQDKKFTTSEQSEVDALSIKVNEVLTYTYGWGSSENYARHSYGGYMDSDGTSTLYTHANIRLHSQELIDGGLLDTAEFSYGSRLGGLGVKDSSFGIFLVSNGGTTLSSLNDPSINFVNGTSSPVPVPTTLGLLGLAIAGLSFRRKKV